MRVAATACSVLAGIAALSLGSVAHAEHDHFVYQPAHGGHSATCRYIADGQTSKAPEEPGGHQFHTHVHLGQPGADTHGTDFDREVNAGNYDCVFVNAP